MNRSANESFMPFLLLAFNNFVFMSGFALLAAGISAIFSPEIALRKEYVVLFIGLTVAACITIIISLIGCFGILAESICLLVSFIISLTIILVLELVTGILVVISNEKKNKEEIREQVTANIDHFWEERKVQSEFWHTIQRNFECCGRNGPSDWLAVDGRVPNSCCLTKDCTEINAFKIGCLDVLVEKLKSIHYIAEILIGFGVINLIGVIGAWYLTHKIRRRNAQLARYDHVFNFLRIKQTKMVSKMNWKYFNSTL